MDEKNIIKKMPNVHIYTKSNLFIKDFFYGTDNIGLIYEATVYKLIKLCIIDRCISFNFIPFNSVELIGNDIIMTTKRLVENDKVKKVSKLSVFIVNSSQTVIDDNISHIFYQILYALRVMARMGINHNDLHYENILVTEYNNPVKLSFREEDGTYVNLTTKYVPYIFDWDISYVEHLGRNYLLDHVLCKANGLCNINSDYKDVYIMICVLSNIIKVMEYFKKIFPEKYLKLLEISDKVNIIKGKLLNKSKNPIYKSQYYGDYELHDLSDGDLKKDGIKTEGVPRYLKDSIRYIIPTSNINRVVKTYTELHKCRPIFYSKDMLSVYELNKIFMKKNKIPSNNKPSGDIICHFPTEDDILYMKKVIGDSPWKKDIKYYSFHKRDLDKYYEYVKNMKKV